MITQVRFLLYSWWESSMVKASNLPFVQFLGAKAVTPSLSVGRRASEPRYRASLYSSSKSRCPSFGSRQYKHIAEARFVRSCRGLRAERA